MVKKAKILEPIGEDFEDVVETIVKKDKDNKKYMKQDVPVKKVKAKKDKKSKKNN